MRRGEIHFRGTRKPVWHQLDCRLVVKALDIGLRQL